MSIAITKTDNTAVVKNTSGFARVFTGPVDIQVSPTGDTIINSFGNGVAFAKADVTDINGSAPASALDDYIEQLRAVFPDASSGAGGGSVTPTAWDGGNILFDKDYR